MMKIQSLLNSPPPPNPLPSYSSLRTRSPPPTPEYTSATSAASTSSPQAPATPVSSIRYLQKPAKDAALFQRGLPKEPVNYAPYECNENNGVLTKIERQELLEQHKKFKVFPSGGEDGLIYDYVRHIPYNSEKKTFFGRTGREGFELFQYVFCLPSDPGKEYVVMWDYQNGLVRITPFFKALNFPKTTPNKVLGCNQGLRELSHSITGGSIAAQGYWMPYGCARAVCATFAWNIRWALTPIFGPSFLKDCLPPTDANYSRFRIDPEVIRVSQRASEGWTEGIVYDDTKMGGLGVTTTQSSSAVTSAPRSTPVPSIARGRGAIVMPPPSPKQLRPRKPRVQTFLDSPFATDSNMDLDDDEDDDDEDVASACNNRYDDSPSVSPKTKVSPATTWTSVNVPGNGSNSGRKCAPSPVDSEDWFMTPPTRAGAGQHEVGVGRRRGAPAAIVQQTTPVATTPRRQQQHSHLMPVLSSPMAPLKTSNVEEQLMPNTPTPLPKTTRSSNKAAKRPFAAILDYGDDSEESYEDHSESYLSSASSYGGGVKTAGTAAGKRPMKTAKTPKRTAPPVAAGTDMRGGFTSREEEAAMILVKMSEADTLLSPPSQHYYIYQDTPVHEYQMQHQRQYTKDYYHHHHHHHHHHQQQQQQQQQHQRFGFQQQDTTALEKLGQMSMRSGGSDNTTATEDGRQATRAWKGKDTSHVFAPDNGDHDGVDDNSHRNEGNDEYDVVAATTADAEAAKKATKKTNAKSTKTAGTAARDKKRRKVGSKKI